MKTNGQANKTKPKSDAAEDLRELLIDELKDIYWAEKTLTKVLPKMAKNASSVQLKNALNAHLKETEMHVTRVEQVFTLLGETAKAKKCEAMAGLVKEGGEILEGTEPGPVRDAGIILACQKVEHYEIATYGTLACFAKILYADKVEKLLRQTLDEEKKADSTLTGLAESAINIEAAEEAEGLANKPALKPAFKKSKATA